MPDEVERFAQHVKDAESLLSRLVDSKRDIASNLPTVYEVLNKLRTSVASLALLDVVHTRKIAAEARLWSAHTQLHSRFRKQLKEFRFASPARPVETRKFTKTYLEFLKDGQRWYRTFIADLNRHYGAIPELRQIAGELISSTPTVYDHETASHCLLSCYQSLISLGDLARWRATEKLDKQPTWGPAIGYYDLAIALRPSSGVAFNQRSIIAQHDRDHLRATYYLYRAIVVELPFERGLDNLGLHMSSLCKKWGGKDFSPKVNAGSDGADKALINWFLRLHSICYAGEAFKGHDEMEAEVIDRLESHVLQSDNSGLLMKIILINMAAERTALIRLRDADDAEHVAILQAFYFHQRLNIKTCSLVMTAWTKIATSGVFSGAQSSPPPAKVTQLISVILPAVRTYCRWLVASCRFLLPESIDDRLKADANGLWVKYTVMLSATIAAYPLSELQQLTYQLEEDVDVSGFQPLDSPEAEFIWHCDDGQVKLKHNDSRVHRSSSHIEIMARIRDLQVIGLHLAAQEDTPVAFENGRYTCDGIDHASAQIRIVSRRSAQRPESTTTGVPATSHALESKGIRGTSGVAPQTTPRLETPPANTKDQTRTPGPLDIQEEFAKSMVDDLVGPDESPHPVKRSGSMFDPYLEDLSTTRVEGSPSSFVPTPPTSRAISRVERLHNTSLFGNGDRPDFTSGMHSPLLFGNGGVWSTAPQRSRSCANETPPNGQGG